MKSYMGDVNRIIINSIKPYVTHDLKLVNQPNTVFFDR